MPSTHTNCARLQHIPEPILSELNCRAKFLDIFLQTCSALVASNCVQAIYKNFRPGSLSPRNPRSAIVITPSARLWLPHVPPERVRLASPCCHSTSCDNTASK